MISVLLFACVLQATGPLADLIDQAGYGFKDHSPSVGTSGTTTYRHRTRDCDMSYWTSALQGESDAAEVFRTIDSMSQRLSPNPDAARPVSGIPLGLHLRYGPSHMGILLRTGSGSAFVKVYMHYAGQRTSTVPKFAPSDPEKDPALVEAVARWLLAKESGKTYKASSVTVSGQSTASIRDSAGRHHLRLNAWASRRGYAVHANLAQARVSVDTAKGPVLVVLGAPEVMVGSEWRRIGGIVVADGDEVCIPAEIITRFGL